MIANLNSGDAGITSVKLEFHCAEQNLSNFYLTPAGKTSPEPMEASSLIDKPIRVATAKNSYVQFSISNVSRDVNLRIGTDAAAPGELYFYVTGS